MIHQLKCERRYFEEVAAGRKTFEVRYNDRDFQEGDFLAMNEITTGEDTPAGYCYTSRSCLVRVDYILEDEKYLQPGYVCMAIKPCGIIPDPNDPEETVTNFIEYLHTNEKR